jgi:hypothetical protein
MEIRFDIAETNAQIFKLAANAIADEFNDVLSRAALPMEKRIRVLVQDAIEAQPEWYALNNGALVEEFGLTNPVAKINTVMRYWINSIVVLFNPFKISGGQLKGRFEISMIRADWSDVLTIPEALQITSKGQPLPWLQWLLIEGDKVIIREYELAQGKKPGRAGGRIMIKTKGRWRVPPQYAGTTNDNFVTRAIDSIAPDFEQIFIDEVTKRF